MPGKGWIVSFSAPAFFPEQEQEEKDNLTPEEAQLIELELHGKPVFDFITYETPTQVSDCLQAMYDYLDHRLDPQLTATYRQALKTVPNIVRRETDPLMFLRAEYFHVERAATRLAQHWKERQELFGAERAFLPMTLAPNGAMGSCPTDMEQLELGFVARVPNDEHGRPVIFLDRSGSTKDPSYQRDCWLRVMWYLVQAICLEEPRYQMSGYVVIINLKDYEPSRCGDRLGAKKMFLCIRECWAPRFMGYHATYGSIQTPVKLLNPAIRAMQGRHIRLHLRHHYGFDADNFQGMKEYGLTADHVSPAIGGTFTMEKHRAWLAEQQAREHKKSTT